MGTTRFFQDMLNEYLTNEMLKEELIKRDFILNTVDKDNNWNGGKIPVPFKAAGGSSVSFGKLTHQDDVSSDEYVRGSIDGYKEVWGTMVFHNKDLQEHKGKIPEKTFLKLLPDSIEDFMDYMKMVVSISLLSGPHFAAVSADGVAGGEVKVNRIDRFVLNQKVVAKGDTYAQHVFYVIGINLNTSTVKLSLTRKGAITDLSALTVADKVKFYHDGILEEGSFINFKEVLLSQANGGSADLHGKSKLLAPFLQAINIDGTSVSATNILERIFDAYSTIRRLARGNATDILMSYKHFGSCMKLIEKDKSPYKVGENTMKATVYGWTELSVMQVASNKTLKLVGIQEMDDDVIMFIDWSGITFRSNGFFKKHQDPNGNEYYTVRAESGFKYLVDISLFGQLEFRKPGTCGIIHDIPNY